MEFEKHQSRVDKGRKNMKRSDKDNAALAKAETDLYHASEVCQTFAAFCGRKHHPLDLASISAVHNEYNTADDHLRDRLPPVITAVFSLLPNLLAAQIMIQNSLLAQSYTVLHEYCGEARFPSPPPAMNEVIACWDRDFRSIQKEVETGFACISHGKAVRQPMKLADQSQGHSISGLNIRNGYAQRRSSSQSSHPRPVAPLAIAAPSEPASPDPNQRPRISSIPSQTSLSLATPNYSSSNGVSPSPSDISSSYAPAGPRADYFSRDRQPSSSSMASIVANKKRPPPPPPKRLPSTQDVWVTALYEFAGQGQGDLVFKEGDRIRVVKKTDSTDDWWEGELRGVQVFNLPPDILLTLRAKESQLHPIPSDTTVDFLNKPSLNSNGNSNGSSTASTSCALCGTTSTSINEQRRHVKSDWHGYNLKQKLRGHAPVTEIEFEKLLEDLNESLSGSDTSTSEDSDEDGGQKESTLSALLKKQARLGYPESEPLDDFSKSGKRKRGAGRPPLLWFTTPSLPSNVSLGIYRALFTLDEQNQETDIVEVIRRKQLQPALSKPPADASNGVPLPSTMTSPQIFLCMVGGGHFAGMIVSLAPKLGKKSTGVEERQAAVIAHKTFHRYTTRRKQGGAQSSNDSAKGAAHSAGASIRRYNEAALESEIRALLAEWKGFIDKSQLIFVRATGSSNRRTLFGPYEGQVLHHNDPRNRGFPFSTRRATQAELMRSFVELTRVKVSEMDEAALAAEAAQTSEAQQQQKSSQLPKPAPSSHPTSSATKEEESLLLHTSQLQALIRRSKAPALLSYLSTNTVSPDFHFHPSTAQSHHHSPTPLHLASSSNSPAIISALLTKAGADPTLRNGEGKPAFDLAGERATRDAFRLARSELGEERWDWAEAHVPPPLTREEVRERSAQEQVEREKVEMERRKGEEERLRREDEVKKERGEEEKGRKGGGRALGAGEKTGSEKREEEARGLSAEMRVRLERERRARAAEERMRRGGGMGGGR
ncbi:MAG: hypothetical protein Q9219_002415 [cf. Caloplaca sp. 3 TL-2023]